MSKETIAYQAELIKQSIDILNDSLTELKQSEKELSDISRDNLIGVVSQVQDVIDISMAQSDEEKIKIMNKWL